MKKGADAEKDFIVQETHHWVTHQDSSIDDEIVHARDLSLMAVEDMKVSKYKEDMEEASKIADGSNLSPSNLCKVRSKWKEI